MGFDRRSVTVTSITTDSATANATTMNLRSTYVRPLSFIVDQGGTADTTLRLKLTDADSRVFYLDAADKDYTTAVYTPLFQDDVATGLSVLAYDSVGVAVAAAQIAPMPVVKSPIVVNTLQATAGSTLEFTLDYEYGVFGKETFTLPTAASSTAVKTVSLKAKYAQILGFKALSVGTSTTQTIEIKDADGKIVYLDAAAKDYDTAALDKTFIMDPTVTNLTQVVPRNATGASPQAGIGRIDPVLSRSPLTITLGASEGNDEVVTMSLYYKTG